MGFELTWLSLEKNSFTGARRLLVAFAFYCR